MRLPHPKLRRQLEAPRGRAQGTTSDTPDGSYEEFDEDHSKTSSPRFAAFHRPRLRRPRNRVGEMS